MKLALARAPQFKESKDWIYKASGLAGKAVGRVEREVLRTAR